MAVVQGSTVTPGDGTQEPTIIVVLPVPIPGQVRLSTRFIWAALDKCRSISSRAGYHRVAAINPTKPTSSVSTQHRNALGIR